MGVGQRVANALFFTQAFVHAFVLAHAKAWWMKSCMRVRVCSCVCSYANAQ